MKNASRVCSKRTSMWGLLRDTLDWKDNLNGFRVSHIPKEDNSLADYITNGYTLGNYYI